MPNHPESPLWERTNRLRRTEYPTCLGTVAPPGISRYGDTLRAVQPRSLITLEDLQMLTDWVGSVSFPDDPDGKLTVVAPLHTGILTQAMQDHAMRNVVSNMCGGVLSVPSHAGENIIYLQKMTERRANNGIAPPPIEVVQTIFQQVPKQLSPLDDTHFSIRTYANPSEKKLFGNKWFDMLHKACGDKADVEHALQSSDCSIATMWDMRKACPAGVVFIETRRFPYWSSMNGLLDVATLTNAYVGPDYRRLGLYGYLQWVATQEVPEDVLFYAETRLDGGVLQAAASSPPGRHCVPLQWTYPGGSLPCLRSEYKFDGPHQSALLPHNIKSGSVFGQMR